MSTLAFFQHFFSSVPADQSPTRQRGYQTLFRTRGLSDDIVRAIEDHAQYTTTPGNPLKRQFYPLPGDSVAISQSVALADLDEFGRRGRYLTHTLVLDGQTLLKQLGGCPLDVFAQFRFAANLNQVFQQGQTASEVPPAKLDIAPGWHIQALQAYRKWPDETLTKLGRLAWQVEELLDKRETIALLGSDADQFEALSILFLLASPPQRLLQSFDTHATGCDWGRGITFWAQGYTDQPDSHTAHLIAVRRHSVTSDLSPSDDGPFALWMVNDVLPNKLESVLKQQEWAAYLDSVLMGRKPMQVVKVPRDFIERFARLNASMVASRWTMQLPDGLSNEFTRPLLGKVESEPVDYLEDMASGTQPQSIQEFVFNATLKLGSVPNKVDRQVLEKWIKMCAHPGLSTLPPLWAKDGNSWSKRLTLLAAEDYEWIMRQLVHWQSLPLPLWEALIGPHAITWIQVVGPVLPPGDWKKVLSMLEKLGDPIFDALAEIVPQLSVPARIEIAKWLDGYRGMATALRASIGIAPKDGKKRARLFS